MVPKPDAWTLLLVEDDPALRGFLFRACERQVQEVNIITASSYQEGKEVVGEERLDAVVADIDVLDADGFSLLEEVASRQPYAARIAIGSSADMRALSRAINRHDTQYFVPKPVSPDELAEVISDGLWAGHRDRIRDAAVQESIDASTSPTQWATVQAVAVPVVQ